MKKFTLGLALMAYLCSIAELAGISKYLPLFASLCAILWGAMAVERWSNTNRRF